MNPDTNPSIQQAVQNALNQIRDRSYGDRHPELGRMFKCQVCKLRHRGQQCQQRFTALYQEEDLDTGEVEVFYAVAPVSRKAPFKGKRQAPHVNQKNLQLVELTQILFDKYDEMTKLDGTKAFPTPLETMRAARGEANVILTRARKAVAKKKSNQQKISRAINRGLAAPGSK